MNAKPRPASEYFIPGDGIDRVVITADISRYLGIDAVVRSGTYEDPSTKQMKKGCFIKAYRSLTTPPPATLEDLKEASGRWRMGLSNPDNEVMAVVANQTTFAKASQLNSIPVVEHITPQRKDLPILINGVHIRACWTEVL